VDPVAASREADTGSTVNLLLAFIGAATASLLCLVLDRTLAGDALATVRSRCECGRELNILEVLPVVSWVVLRGRARCCNVKLPVRWPLEELTVGVAFFVSGYLNLLLGVALCVVTLGVVGSIELLAQVRNLRELPILREPRRSLS
jgi:prepilin signal peptidase PulO-like enzyme (type II secretory pathway)